LSRVVGVEQQTESHSEPSEKAKVLGGIVLFIHAGTIPRIESVFEEISRAC